MADTHHDRMIAALTAAAQAATAHTDATKGIVQAYLDAESSESESEKE